MNQIKCFSKKHFWIWIKQQKAVFLRQPSVLFFDILYKENKLPNMAFVLNDTEVAKGYGYGSYGYGNYGYGHTELKKPWYKTLFKK